MLVPCTKGSFPQSADYPVGSGERPKIQGTNIMYDLVFLYYDISVKCIFLFEEKFQSLSVKYVFQ